MAKEWNKLSIPSKVSSFHVEIDGAVNDGRAGSQADGSYLCIVLGSSSRVDISSSPDDGSTLA